MTPAQALAKLDSAQLLPVYLLLGEEPYERDRVLRRLREEVMKDAIAGLGEDDFSAGQAPIASVLSAARTPPMMSRRRLVLVRDVDKWETKKPGGEASKASDGPLDLISEYAAAPLPTTVLVLVGTKLNARRKLVSLAKRQDFIVQCDPLHKNELGRWVTQHVRERGGRIQSGAAELLAEVKGPELSTLADAVERLCLYSGEDEITEDTLTEIMPVVRPATVWELVDAVSRRDVGEALSRLARIYDPKDRGLPVLGILAWSARQLIRFKAARTEGASASEAAKAAGAPPFRASALDKQLQRLSPEHLDEWLCVLRDLDLALKGASRLPPLDILETAIIQLCATPNR